MQAATEPPEVEKPNWTLRDLPLQFGTWHGEDTEMDPKIAVATGADVIVNRIYRDEAGHASPCTPPRSWIRPKAFTTVP